MISRPLTLLSISSLAVLLSSLSLTPVAAISLDFTPYHARSLHHDALALRKRTPNLIKRCRPRPQPAPQASPAPVRAPPATPAPAPAPAAPKYFPPGNLGVLGPGKAMASWPNGDDGLKAWSDIFNIKIIYTWNPSCPPGAAGFGIVCCPMFWGSKFASDFDKAAPGAKCLMGHNEPEIVGQSNTSPEQASAEWNQHIKPHKANGAVLISPAVTSDQDQALAWMGKFIELQGGIDASGIDVFAIHFYDIDFQKFKDWATTFHNKFSRPIMVTEIACQNFNGPNQCSQDQIYAFNGQVAEFVKQTDWIIKIAPFGTMRDMTNVNPLAQMMNPQSGMPNDVAYAFFNTLNH